MQDFPGQKWGINYPVLRKNPSLTSPSLQDAFCGDFYPVPSVKADCFPNIPDADTCIFANNLGFVLSNIVDFLADPLHIGDHLLSFSFANAFF